jgi:ATP-dependent DNA helicase RecQ
LAGVLWQLISARLVEHDRADRDRLVVTEAGRVVLRGNGEFALREDVVAARTRRSKKAPPLANGADSDLLAALKDLRGELARAQKQPAYVIFPDRSLIEMAERKPRTLDELAGVHGVGAAKLQKYGRVFLQIIASHSDA